MSVHYKFKSALDFDTITFDGLHISVSDLKKAIVHQKRLGKTCDFDLQITNAQTKEEYPDNGTLIPKNTSLIIARIPLANQSKKPWETNNEKNSNTRSNAEKDHANLDLTRMNGSEDDKIHAMMIQSTMDYDPNNYHKIRGASQTGEVPSTYRCYKCHKPGHWIKNCPLGGSNREHSEMKRNTGIPRSFIENDKKSEISQPITPAVIEPKQEIPEDLICSICKDLFTDAVMIPCCGSSFCDDCVRTALLESEDNECPDCKEKGTPPGSLIPNRFLRNSVNAFKNETGYSKPRPVPKVTADSTPEPVVHALNDTPEEDRNSNEDEPIPTPSPIPPSPPEPAETEPVIEETNTQEAPEDSDYEDNITVTVPAPSTQVRNVFHERHGYNQNPYNLKPPGLDTPPKNMSQLNNEENTESTASDEKESYANPSVGADMNRMQRPPMMNHQDQHGIRPMHPNYHGSHPMGDGMRQMGDPYMMQGNYPMQNSMQRPYEGDPSYGHSGMHPQNYMPRPYDHNMMQRGPYPMRGYNGPNMMQHSYPPRPHGPMGPMGNIPPNYPQGVPGKLGPGIIDDPLEEFNRIMREKERRRAEQQRQRFSPDQRRRSGSVEMERRRSPRGTSPDQRRGPPPSRMMERRSEERDRRRRRSSSYSSRGRSRSYSRSRSHSNHRRSRSVNKRRSRSPMKYSRSRSPGYKPPNRTRSRSFSPNRYQGYNMNHYRFNRSPPPQFRGVSPSRSRYRDSGGRMDRREEFNRGDYRNRSPHQERYDNSFQSRSSRGSYRGRGRGNVMRNDRSSSSYMHNNESQNMTGNYSHGGHPTDGYMQKSNRYHRDDEMHFRQNNCPLGGQYNDGQNYGNPQFNPTDMSMEPPPPGFESGRLSPDRNTWNTGEQRTPFDSSYGGDRGPNQDNRDPSKDLRHDSNNRDRNSADNNKQLSGGPSNDGSHRKRSPISRSPGNWDSRRSASKHYRSRSRSKSRIGRDREREAQKSTHERKTSRDYEKRDRDVKRRTRSKEKDISSHRSSDRKDKDRERDREREREKEREREREKERDRDRNRDKTKEKEKEKEKLKTKEKEKERPKEKELEKEKDRDKTTDSSDIEKMDKKSKDKKKKSKKEKEVEKKKKKDKKEKDKREKESKKLESEQNLIEAENIQSNENHLEPQVHVNPHDSFDIPSQSCNADLEEAPMVCLGDNQPDRSPQGLNRNDSILEIHANLDFELEDDIKPGSDQQSGACTVDDNFSQMPAPSKWELDEETNTEKRSVDQSNLQDAQSDGKVTSEVLKRAENAIFARANTAIKPIEIKKVSTDRQKLYTSEKNHADIPLQSVVSFVTSPKHEMHITVPANSASSEVRNVEVKSDVIKPDVNSSSSSRSVKDRLGDKLKDDLRHQISRNRSPANIRQGSSRDDRSSDKKLNNTKSNEGTSRRESSRGRINSEVERDRPNRRQDGSSSNNNRDEQRYRDEKRQRDVRRSPSKPTSTSRFENRHRDYNSSGVRNQSRDVINDRSRVDRSRENRRDRSRSRDGLSHRNLSNRNRSRERDRDSQWQNDLRSNSRNQNRNGIEKPSSNDDRRRETNSDKANVKPYSNDNGPKLRSTEKEIEYKRKLEQGHHSRDGNAISNSEQNEEMAKGEKNDRDIISPKKRRRSSSSSSTTSASSSNSSGSDDKKRSKKKKHKKQKRSKRSSSESGDSSNGKKKKSKKSKKSKKKKKSKK